MRYISPSHISHLGPIIALFLILSGSAGLADDKQDSLVNAGIAAYDSGNYQDAVKNFKRAIQSTPDTSLLHHWLGKSYGRIAERGNWFKAMSYSKKTLKQFRKAVELDSSNHDALRDLIDYLETAPGFLGGNKKEAKRLTPQLAALKNVYEPGNE